MFVIIGRSAPGLDLSTDSCEEKFFFVCLGGGGKRKIRIFAEGGGGLVLSIS
jgi:hypothetical protein